MTKKNGRKDFPKELKPDCLPNNHPEFSPPKVIDLFKDRSMINLFDINAVEK